MTSGKVLDTTVVYPTYGERQKKDAIAKLTALCKKHGVTHIAIGNGTASRETEQMTVEMLRGLPGVSYMIVNEAGASVYSASKLAAEEFPDYDVNLRRARRCCLSAPSWSRISPSWTIPRSGPCFWRIWALRSPVWTG